MLPKSKRLTKEDFKSLHGKVSFRGDFFDVVTAPSPFLKYACVISKKKIKTAVERNKVKRRIFNYVSKVDIKKPYLIIFYIKNKANNVKYELLKKEISQFFDTLQ